MREIDRSAAFHGRISDLSEGIVDIKLSTITNASTEASTLTQKRAAHEGPQEWFDKGSRLRRFLAFWPT